MWPLRRQNCNLFQFSRPCRSGVRTARPQVRAPDCGHDDRPPVRPGSDRRTVRRRHLRPQLRRRLRPSGIRPTTPPSHRSTGFHRLAGPGESVLELGIGTGRLALPLAERGLVVTGHGLLARDARALRLTCRHGPPDRGRSPGRRHRRGHSATSRSTRDWPAGPYDLVVATNNLLLNLAEASAQSSLHRPGRCGPRPRWTPGGRDDPGPTVRRRRSDARTCRT